MRRLIREIIQEFRLHRLFKKAGYRVTTDGTSCSPSIVVHYPNGIRGHFTHIWAAYECDADHIWKEIRKDYDRRLGL